MKIALTYIPLACWMMVIFFLSDQQTLPGSSISMFDLVLKKTGHVVVYAVLWLLSVRAFSNHMQRQNAINAAFLFCLLYAISDEFHQSFVPGRHPSALDVGFDAVGMILAFFSIRTRWGGAKN
ncbi:MAG: VanZ family protein [Pseudomonadales bacterium]|nr:VanZ family protein [Pseudomonadales bacterium]